MPDTDHALTRGSRIDRHSNDMVMLRLAETHCVPILTYAIEVIDVANRDELRQLRVAYNSLFRKIFKYRWNESVTALQHFLKRPTWEELADKRRTNFVVDSTHSLVYLFALPMSNLCNTFVCFLLVVICATHFMCE